MAIAVLSGGLGIGLSKKAENKRKQAAANEYSSKYPLLNDCGPMEDSIKNAVFELKTIDSAPVNTAGAKRIKKRNSDALRSWVSVMKEHLKDLTCGINVASTQTAMVEPSSRSTATEILRPEKSEKLEDVKTEESQAKNDENPAPPNNKKGVNWLLIGGVAIGVFAIFKFMKK
jgi:hypothetical protein